MGSTKKPESFHPPTGFRSTLEFAQHLGLSRWTVSRVINGHNDVHPETVRRVRAAMEEYGFSPNPLAKGLRHGRTSLVGVCVPDLDVFHLGQKLGLLHHALEANGLQMHLSMRGESASEEVQALNRFREMRVAGLVVIASRLLPDSPTLARLQQAGIPLVMVDPLHPDIERSLSVDRAKGMHEAFHHLLDLGHRRFATLGLSSGGAYSRLRRDTLDQLALESGVRIRHLPIPESGTFYEAARTASAALTGKLVQQSPSRRITAVLTVNDRAAITLIDAAREHGLSIPGDLSIVGYDNMEVGQYLTPRLTSIDTVPDRLIEQTTARLLEALRGTLPPTPQPLQTRLVTRETTASTL